MYFKTRYKKLFISKYIPFACYGQTVVDKLMKTHNNTHTY